MPHGRDPQRSGPENNVYAAACLCGDTYRALTQDTADAHLDDHIAAEQPGEKAA